MIVTLTTDTHYGFNDKSHAHHYKMLRRIRAGMEKVGSKVLLHTGDWIASKQRQLYRVFEIFREQLGADIQVLGVLGNHCVWHELEVRSWDDMHTARRHAAEANRIHLLSDSGPVIIDDVIFAGFDGWYKERNPATNDRRWMLPAGPAGEDVFLYKQAVAAEQFQTVLDLDTSKYRAAVCLTHMPLEPGPFNGNDKWLEFLENKFTHVCWGHTHTSCAKTLPSGLKIYNAGSDYGHIKHLFFEV